MRQHKSHISLLALSTSFVLLFSLLTISQSASGFDATPPRVESCEINVKSIPATGGEVTVTAQIKSVNDLERTPIIRMFNEGYDRWIADINYAKLVTGDLKFGTWTSTFTVLADRKPDRYYVKFDALYDKGGNSDRAPFMCKNAYVDYGGYIPLASTPTPTPFPTPAPTVTVTATPAPAPTVTVTATPAPAPTVYVKNPVDLDLSDSIARLQIQVSTLNAKLKKICAAKRKPKGC
jgi:hypothetical protein